MSIEKSSRFFHIKDNIIIGIHSDAIVVPNTEQLVEATAEDPEALIGLTSDYIARPIGDRPTAESRDPSTPCEKILNEARVLFHEIKFLEDFDDKVDLTDKINRYNDLKTDWVTASCTIDPILPA